MPQDDKFVSNDVSGTHSPVLTSLETYESLFAHLVRAERGIAFGYARTALCSILTALGIGPGEEVVLSPLTCKVVPLSLLSLKIKPRYVDINRDTLNMDSRVISSAIHLGTGAILFQHTYGNSAGIRQVANLAKEKDLSLIEDCAQSIPYEVEHSMPGSWGRAAIFSNNFLKPIPAGSGGMATTNEIVLAEKIKKVRHSYSQPGSLQNLMFQLERWVHHSLVNPRRYWPLFELNRKLSVSYRVRPIEVEIASEITGKASQVSSLQIQEGQKWLENLDPLVQHRQLCCQEYAQALDDCEHLHLPVKEGSSPLYYFPVLVRDKEGLLQQARKSRVEVIAWPTKTPIYPLEEKKDLVAYGYEPQSCPVAEEVAGQLIGLPTHQKILARERDQIVSLIKNFNS